MRSQAVLVLGTYANKGLIDILFGIGLAPLVRANIQGVLDKLRHEQCAAVILRTSCHVAITRLLHSGHLSLVKDIGVAQTGHSGQVRSKA